MHAAAGPFLDLQVNGYAGVDFNSDELSGETLHIACERLAEDGVAGVLATIISAPLDRMIARLERVARLRAADPAGDRANRGHAYRGPISQRAPRLRGRSSGGRRCDWPTRA